MKALKKKGIRVSRSRVKKALEDDPTYQTSRALKKRFTRRKTITFYFSERWESDVGDIGSERFIDRNTGEEKGRFFLICVDVFSKRIFAEAMDGKKASDALRAFQSILSRLQAPYTAPLALEFDLGSEFKGPFLAFLQQEGIRPIYARGQSKARIAERSIRSFKKVLVPFLETDPLQSWEEAVSRVCRNLNGRFNRSLGMSPDDVTQQWRTVQAANLDKHTILPFRSYLETQANIKAGEAVRDDKRSFALGQRVYVPYKQDILDKESDRQFTRQIFTISEILSAQKPYLYRLTDGKGSKVSRPYYAQELRVAKEPETYPIQRILKRKTIRGRPMYYVRWLDHDRRFDEWISEGQIQKK